MAAQVFAFILHKDGKADDTAMELAAAAQKMASEAPIAIVTGAGAGLDGVCQELIGGYAEVWKFASEALAYPNAEIIRTLLLKVLPKGCTLLLPHTTFGMDLGPGLAVKMDAAYVPDVTALDGVDGGTLKAVRQEFNGQVSTHLACDISNGAVISVRSGCFPAGAAGAAGGKIIDKSPEVGEIPARRRFVEVLQAEVGDVDITKEDVLVSVGRGIGDKENLPLADELAKAMGAVVSCSRPVVDAKWLEKSRQVGTSGKTVKPKVYLALGISGSFQHMGGLKGNPFIVAVNKNPKAPIFQVANVGVVADVLEFVPELTEKIKSVK
ncbi:MAG: electron transfer flavoprotein subunit alpha/FixB family protein [Desulfobacterales bacterium]|jgi:electron transfer flavoprotein alpha subunit|nr:electron transfer flavoprotein subunit alpha/FixB family protein [Desulfobacterales bacterium]